MGPLQFYLSIFQGIQRNSKQKAFIIPVRESWWPYQQGTAIPAHSKKMPKWHFLTPAWYLKIFGPNAFIWSAILWFYPQFVPGSAQVLIQVDRWDYFKNSPTGFFFSFVQGFYESVERLEGKIGEAPFFKDSTW